MKAIITVGCSGSGKSTWAREYVDIHPGTHIIERDIIRQEILKSKGIEYFNMWAKWNFKWEKDVTIKFNEKLDLYRKQNKGIIISDTNLNKGRRDALKLKLEEFGYEVEMQFFGLDDTLDTLWKRDTYRQHTVGHRTIAKQYKEFLEQFPKYSLKDVSNKPECILVDLDGTLAHMNGKRGPFDWAKVGGDSVDKVVATIVENINTHVIYMSGRDSCCRAETIQWLINNLYIEPTYIDAHLFMRAEGDMRKDTIVKEELFFKHIDGNYKVIGVIDDRPAVVRTWQDFGFKVYACANQNLEF